MNWRQTNSVMYMAHMNCRVTMIMWTMANGHPQGKKTYVIFYVQNVPMFYAHWNRMDGQKLILNWSKKKTKISNGILRKLNTPFLLRNWLAREFAYITSGKSNAMHRLILFMPAHHTRNFVYIHYAIILCQSLNWQFTMLRSVAKS